MRGIPFQGRFIGVQGPFVIGLLEPGVAEVVQGLGGDGFAPGGGEGAFGARVIPGPVKGDAAPVGVLEPRGSRRVVPAFEGRRRLLGRVPERPGPHDTQPQEQGPEEPDRRGRGSRDPIQAHHLASRGAARPRTQGHSRSNISATNPPYSSRHTRRVSAPGVVVMPSAARASCNAAVSSPRKSACR